MNIAMEAFARGQLKSGLKKCTPEQQSMFKRMYSHDNLQLSIDQVVDNMPADKLERAMFQVSNTK